MTVDTFSFELTFNQHLRCNSRMVGPNLPERAAAFHSVVANERIHNRLLKPMPHVQGACDVGWRDGNAVRRFTGAGAK